MQLIGRKPDESVDLDALYRTQERKLPNERSYVVVNMVASVDGGTAVGGKSGPLGGSADKDIFAILRATVDVILVGRRTIETEGYGPLELADVHRKQRTAAGKKPLPSIAVVSNELDLDWSAPFFADAEVTPLVITSQSCSREKRSEAEQVAELFIAGEKEVDLQKALVELRGRGRELVLCEGGPTLNGGLAAAGVIDELCLTLSPALIGGTSKRIINGSQLGQRDVQLEHVLEDDGFLFLRYRRN